MSNKLGMGKYRRGMTSALERAHDRIRELEAQQAKLVAALRAVRPAYLEYCDNADIIDKALAGSHLETQGKQVGCEDEQGLLIVHPESETCHVCHTTDPDSRA